MIDAAEPTPGVIIPESCRELAQRMVTIESINEHHSGRPLPETQLAEYIETVSHAWGLTTRRLTVSGTEACNLIVEHVVEPDAPWLLMESHMDTVGVEGMTIDPFAGRIDDGRLWGRGACDTKGSGAAMLWALKSYSGAPSKKNNVALLFTVDEEARQTGISSFARSHLDSMPGLPFGAIVGEPTRLRPVIAHCGVARFCIRTHGLAAHSSDPSKGRSAIGMMVKVLVALESRYINQLAVSHPLTGPAHCSINIIHGGSAVNIVPDRCEAWVDRRVVPGEDPEAVIPEVERVLDELRSEESTLSYSITDIRRSSPLDPTGSDSFITLVTDSLRRLGMPYETCGAGHGSDGSVIKTAGIPVVLLGPGEIAQAHSDAEYLELDQLDRAVEVYLEVMKSRPETEV